MTASQACAGLSSYPSSSRSARLDPASDRGHQRGIHQQVQGDPSRRVSRRERVPGAHRLRVRAFPRLDRDVEMTCGVGDLGQ